MLLEEQDYNSGDQEPVADTKWIVFGSAITFLFLNLVCNYDSPTCNKLYVT